MSENQGIRLRLKSRMIAAIVGGENQDVVDIPAGAEVLALDPLDHTASRTKEVKIQWDGKTLSAFAVDLQHRGERIDPSDSG